MSDDPRSSVDPENYYDDLGEDEWTRLVETTKSRFEFENTIDYLEQHLPESGRILDAGGAAGRYAVWLAERGYDVTLLDLSAEQVAIAREKIREEGVADRVTCQQGDIRDLPFGAAEFDATCCLGGPLSHVTDSAERGAVVRELRRVTRSGRPLFVSVMGFVAVVQNLIKVAGEFPQGAKQLPDLVESKTYSAELVEKHDIEEPSFVACHFFRADELERVLTDAGFEVEIVAGLEGPASNFDAEIEAADADDQRRIADVVRELREDRTVADISNHILAVARA